MAGALWWLNLWGEPSLDRLRNAVMKHPGRLRKTVTDLFDWIGTLLRELLHPPPQVVNQQWVNSSEVVSGILG